MWLSGEGLSGEGLSIPLLALASMASCVCVELCYQECFEIAGGARDACWTDTNEDACIASVKQVGTPTCVPAYAILCVVMFSCCASSLVVLHLKNILMKGHALDPDYTQPG